ncbi:MAG: zf-HC2 domain-containing protein [Acidobacteriota bacterium]
MAEMIERAGHLSDAEIDAYWTGRLATADEEKVELHLLECADCRERAAAVEALVEGLRAEPRATTRSRVRIWQVAAASFAIAAAGATVQLLRVQRAAAPVVETLPAQGLTVVALAPPTRSADAPEVAVAADVSIVVFELDAAEAGAALGPCDVTLSGPDGRPLARLTGVAPTGGVVRVPIDRAQLSPGRFVFEVAGPSGTVTLPFLLRTADLR